MSIPVPQMADFCRLFLLASSLHNPDRGRRMVPRPGSGRQKMTLSYISLQQLALSIVGAVVASSLFISAAVGPVPVI